MSCLRAHSLCGGMLVLAAFGSNARAAESEAPPTLSEAPVQAIWKGQEIAFTYQSFTTFYSCSSLEAKIRRLLIAVGAEPNLKIRTRGCFSSSEIARMPYVEIQVVSPVEATPEELAELDKTRSTRELAARVRGDSKQAERAEAQFPAQWTQVSLSRGKLNLEPGDCELIEQLKEKVLPKLAIKVIEDRTECTPHRISMTQPRLVVEALTPMASPDETDKNANEKEEEEEKEKEKT